jgi:hypothetical protein
VPAELILFYQSLIVLPEEELVQLVFVREQFWRDGVEKFQGALVVAVPPLEISET